MRSYRMFLGYAGDTVLESLRCMENLGWHHMATDERQRTYQSLVGLLNEIGERAKHYVNEKGGTGEARVAAQRLRAAEDGMDRLLAAFHSGGWRPGGYKPELDGDVWSEAGLDGDTDVDRPDFPE